MEHIFETSSGVGLYLDGDRYISRNPAEVFACLLQDFKSEDFLAKLNSSFLMHEIAKKGGIYYSDKGPKNIMSDKKGIFFASDDESHVFGFSTTVKFDFEVFEKLANNKKLVLI